MKTPVSITEVILKMMLPNGLNAKSPEDFPPLKTYGKPKLKIGDVRKPARRRNIIKGRVG